MIRLILCLVLTCFFLPGCQYNNNPDPLEYTNRKIFSFNHSVDKMVFKPVAQAYITAVPATPRMMIHNFSNNIESSVDMPFQLLGAHWSNSANTLTRIILNTVLGVGGLFDVAEEFGLSNENISLGEVAKQYGIKPIFIVIPFLGPTTTIDFAGTITKGVLTNQYIMTERGPRIGFSTTKFLDKRSSLLSFDKILEKKKDPYLYARAGIMGTDKKFSYPDY